MTPFKGETRFHLVHTNCNRIIYSTSVLFSPPFFYWYRKLATSAKGGQCGTGYFTSVIKHFDAILTPRLCVMKHFGTFASFKPHSTISTDGSTTIIINIYYVLVTLCILWLGIWQKKTEKLPIVVQFDELINISDDCSFDVVCPQYDGNKKNKTTSPHENFAAAMRNDFNAWLENNDDDDFYSIIFKV